MFANGRNQKKENEKGEFKRVELPNELSFTPQSNKLA
jgi:hypothetical protein